MEAEQHHREMYKQSTQASIDFAKMVLNGTFFLNGAAATALLASKVGVLLAPALWYAVGAFFSILATGASYVFTMLLAESWRNPPETFTAKTISFSIIGREKLLSSRDIEMWRLVPAGLLIISMVMFVVGTILVALVEVPLS